MKKIVKTLKMWLAAAALAMGFSGNANAACCYVPMEIVAAAITASTTAITGAIGASTTALSTLITNATMLPTSPLIMEIQKAGATNVAQTKTLMEAQAAIAKAQTDAAHNQMQNVAADTLKVQAIENSRPVAGCSALSTVVARRMAGAGAAAAGGGGSNNRKVVDRLVNSASPQAAAAEVINNSRANYCSAEDAAKGLCAAAEPAYRNADISASAFFNGASADGKVTLSMDERQRKAQEDFIRNVVAPIPEPRLDPATEKTPQGQAYMAMHKGMSGKKSVVAKFFTDYKASTDPTLPDAGTASAALARAQESGYVSPMLPANTSRLSYEQLLELEANRRYMGKDWQTKTIDAAGNEAALLKEIAKMQAFQLHLAHLQLKELQQIRAVASVAAGELVEMNSAPKLAAQRDAAIKSLR